MTLRLLYPPRHPDAHGSFPGSLLVCLAGVMLAVAGCTRHNQPATQPANDPAAGAPLFNSKPMQPVADGKPRPSDQYVLLVRLRMVPLEVPLGTVSTSERLWSYHDEEVVGLAAQAALNRNGIRVGRGNMDNWPAVRKILREMTGKTVEETNYMAKPGAPVTVTLKARQDVQQIFTFSSGGELVGSDYPPGDNLLVLSCSLNEDDPSGVTIQGVPMVRSTYQKPEYVKTDLGYMLKDEPEEFPLKELQFSVQAPRGTYLVIGPGPAAEHATSPGSKFLVNTRNGLQYETLLLLVPEVFAAPIAATNSPGK